jgi:hypothetical protein
MHQADLSHRAAERQPAELEEVPEDLPHAAILVPSPRIPAGPAESFKQPWEIIQNERREQSQRDCLL